MSQWSGTSLLYNHTAKDLRRCVLKETCHPSSPPLSSHLSSPTKDEHSRGESREPLSPPFLSFRPPPPLAPVALRPPPFRHNARLGYADRQPASHIRTPPAPHCATPIYKLPYPHCVMRSRIRRAYLLLLHYALPPPRLRHRHRRRCGWLAAWTGPIGRRPRGNVD